VCVRACVRARVCVCARVCVYTRAYTHTRAHTHTHLRALYDEWEYSLKHTHTHTHTHLRSLDDDRVRGEINTPRQGRSAHQHLNDAIRKHLFHHVPVRAEDPGIVAREPACQYKQ
jgi:hypothetical protein